MIFAAPFVAPFGEAQEAGLAVSVGRDLALDTTDHDLLLVNGDLTLVVDANAIRQEADIRMRFFLAEWFLDETAGLPYFQNILVKAPNLAAIRAIFLDELQTSAGVVNVKELNTTFNVGTRTLDVSWSAVCSLDELVSDTITFEV